MLLPASGYSPANCFSINSFIYALHSSFLFLSHLGRVDNLKSHLMSLWQLILFGEIVLAQKVMYEKFGNDFLVHFVSKGFPSAHCPQDLTEQYCQKLQVILFNFDNVPSG